MPRNGGLSVASGVARGVNAFTQSYLQASQQENALKLAKNDRLGQLLLGRIGDDQITHDERSAYVREYGKLYNQPDLDQVLGMHKLDNTDVQVGTKDVKLAQQIPSVSQNPDGTMNRVPVPDDAPTTREAPVFKKYQDTTPAEVKLKLQTDLEKVRGDREVSQAKQLYQAQVDILGKDGYSQFVASSYDPVTKDFRAVYRRASDGATKDAVLHNFNPLKLEEAGIKAAGSGSDKPSVFVRDQMRYWQTITNPETNELYTPEEASIKALNDAHKKFSSTEDLKAAQTASTQMGNAGLKPPTQEQNIDDVRANQQIRLGLQTTYDNLTADSEAASNDSAQKAADVTLNYETVVKPLQQELSEITDKTVPEYITKERQLNQALAQYQHLKTIAELAAKHDTSLQKRAAASKKRVEDFDNNQPAPSKGTKSTKTTNSPTQKMSDKDKADVAVVKNNPKNAAAVAGMSDQAILDYINAHRKK